MTKLALLLATISVTGCDDRDSEPRTSTAASAITQLSIPTVSPAGAPYFEKMHNLPDHSSAQLNFELELNNTGTTPVQLDQVDITYALDGAPYGVSPVVAAADLREHYLRGCARGGFGAALDGTLVLDVPALAAEELSDVQVPSANVYGTVHGTERRTDPQTGKSVDIGRFAAVEIEDGHTLAWTTIVPWFGWEDRANALAPADAADSAYVAVGGARPYGGPWQFAAVKLGLDGTIAWKTNINFAGCSAEALDVERVTVGALDNLYFLAGDVVCAGDARIGVALLDGNGTKVWQSMFDPGVKPSHVGGVAVDPATNDLYVVGQLGDYVLIAKFGIGGALDLGFGPGGTGFNAIILPTYDRVFARDAKVLSDGRIAIAAEGRRIATGATQLGMWRFNATGTLDFSLGGQGFVWRSVPGLATARGRDIEVHENETWFTVSGYGDTPGRHFVAAAFDAAGNVHHEFDSDGFLALALPSVPVVSRSFLRGDYITVVGGTGSRIAGARFNRLDGTLDDPTVLSPGERCALLWPDTGVALAGTSHATNLWIWNQIPQDVHADLHLHPVTGGSPIVASWGHALAMFADDPSVEKNFPGERNDEHDEWWFVSQGHEIGTNHRGGGAFSASLDAYVATQRYAYDLTMRRWTGGASDNGVWTDVADPDPAACDDGKLNCHKVVWGKPVHPIADGDIIACSWGVEENAGPGQSDVVAKCSQTSTMPCFYGKGGNSFRIRHADGKISSYFHMQNRDDTLCPHRGPTQLLEKPIHVTRDTVLGLVGNSGQSGGPHLHVQLWAPLPALELPDDFDWTDADARSAEWTRREDYADGVPLMFHDMIGVDASLTPSHFPAEATPSIPVAHFGGSILRHLPSGETPPETGCAETTPLGWPVTVAMQPDGDAPHHNGRPLYCEDDGDTVKVCVENDDSTSECQSCGGETVYPGCPCARQSDCGLDLACWGVPDGDPGPNAPPIGRCYPATGAPDWICPYDCTAQYPNGGWCYSQHPSGQARCMDPTVSDIDVDVCWNAQPGPLTPDLDGGCTQECTTDADCLAKGYPEPIPYHCAGNGVCMR